jgi:hypothetical protein
VREARVSSRGTLSTLVAFVLLILASSRRIPTPWIEEMKLPARMQGSVKLDAT